MIVMTIRQAGVSALFALFLVAALLGVASAVQGNGVGDGVAPARLAANINAAGNDYDSDNDGLIEVDSLVRLNAIRWDLDGNGAADAAGVDEETAADNAANYGAAFPDPAPGMGCPSTGCAGYELTKDLDFDADADGAAYTKGQGWAPIGSRTNPYTATFDGNGHTIANLFINEPHTDRTGLFGGISTNGAVQNLGLINVKVNYGGPAAVDAAIGSLVGTNMGTVDNCYATGAIASYRSDDGKNRVFTIGGLVGHLRDGTISNSHAAVAVSGAGSSNAEDRDRIGGLVGTVTLRRSAIIASYATGSVSTGDYGRAGGLVGSLWRAGTITSSYATGAVSGGNHSSVGGLVGLNGVEGYNITASYAAGPVSGGADASVGGLTGNVQPDGRITDSYAIGAVSAGAGSTTGGLTSEGVPTTANNYWNADSTGQVDSAGGTGLSARDLQSPTGNAGPYENWQSTQWDFGTARQYPAVQHDGNLVPGQRQTSLQVDWNRPVVGEPVVAVLDVAGADDIAWQWQRSAAGAKWRDIADATESVYIPVADDADGGGKYLRAVINFTAAGKRQTLTTYNTAKVAAKAEAEPAADATTFVPDVAVGRRLEFAVPAAADDADGDGESVRHQTYRWQRCSDRAMTTECRYLPAGAAAYTITAADVGKYLRAYVYYAEGAAWKRAASPVLGPVVAAPPDSAP